MDSLNPSLQNFHVDSDFVRKIGHVAETLCNLNYLIIEEADDPGKVLLYAEASQESLQALVQLALQRLR